MENLSQTSSAAHSRADNLVKPWLEFNVNSSSFKRLNQLATALDIDCRQRLPGCVLGGLLANREPEIRQEAIQKLLGGFLTGNRQLLVATEKGNHATISSELSRSISAALNYARWELARLIKKEADRHVEFRERHGGVCHHPRTDGTASGIPHSDRTRMAIESLAVAVRSGAIGRSSASIAEMIIIDGMSASEIARQLGISRQAVHQRMGRVERVLGGIVEKMEWQTGD